MIEYLKIEITPTCFAGTENKELRIQIKTDKKVFEKTEICQPNDLTSFFDRIWECAKKETLKALKER